MREIKYWLKVLFLLALSCVALEIIGGTSCLKTSVLSLSPLQQATSYVFGQADDWWRGFTQFKTLSENNDKLEAEIRALRSERSRLLTYKVQNLRLQSLLELKAQLPGQVKLSARVIARDPNNWGEKVILDRGRHDGVTENMVAVAPEGLVGRVSQVGSRSCTLSLIGSENLAVPVALADSDVCGIMRTNKMMRSVIKYIRFDVPIKPGQLVVTSGLGDVYPGGLAVGRVERSYVSKEAMYQDVLVKLSAELPRLREVILITKGDSSADPAIFKDAIIRAEQEAKQAAKESAEAALRASNKGLPPESDWSEINEEVPESNDQTWSSQSEPLKSSSSSSSSSSNTTPSDNVRSVNIVEKPRQNISGEVRSQTETSIPDNSVDTAPATAEHADEAPPESSSQSTNEQASEGAESHYITVEETDDGSQEEPISDEETLESIPTPNALELES